LAVVACRVIAAFFAIGLRRSRAKPYLRDDCCRTKSNGPPFAVCAIEQVRFGRASLPNVAVDIGKYDKVPSGDAPQFKPIVRRFVER
jgi:hypothetical protein